MFDENGKAGLVEATIVTIFFFALLIALRPELKEWG